MPLVADLISEPKDGDCAEALDLLRPELQEVFGCEGNCIDMSMKPSQIFYELEEKFGFVGGSEYEYI